MAAQLLTEQQENFIYAAAGASGILLLLALLLYSRFRAKRRVAKTLEEKNQEIEEARQQSDELLLNILPGPIAEELKANGKAAARQFDEATVLFSDFQNFTLIAEQLSPEELVQELDKCFKGFDFIISQYPDIEKIKTIGDAYMCASGLNDRKALPNNLVKAALEMQAFLEEQKQERMRIGKPYFEARIGIHTGPVVAGVVGVKKFAYDIWGDTVNIAARVESKSQAGRVNISETTYGLIKYHFACEYRGKVEAKNKGMLDMYFVERELTSATVSA
jgi:class 3 adenylate cyclase